MKPWTDKLKKYIDPDDLKKRAKDKIVKWVKKLPGGAWLLLLPEFAEILAAEAALGFLEELIDRAIIEYGKEEVEKYIEKKLKKRLKEANKRERIESENFKKAMLEIILKAGIDKNKKHHPLYFLVSPKTRSWA